MKRMSLTIGWLGALAGAALAGPANYQQYIPGGRAAGMGGAAVASGNSVDAAYYNPAGLANSTNNSLSVSGNLLGYQNYDVADALFPGEDYDTDSFVTIPTTISAMMRMRPDLTLGFSIICPAMNSTSDMMAYAQRQHVYSFTQEEQELFIGPSAGWQVNPDLALGASIFVGYNYASGTEALFWGDQNISQNTYFRMRSMELLAQVGAQYRLADEWRVGASITTPSLHITDYGRLQYTVAAPDRGLPPSNVYGDNLDALVEIPVKLNGGVFWGRPRQYGVGLDLTYHFSSQYDELKGQLSDGTEFAQAARREAVLDVNLGGEYYFQKIYPVRAGFFTSRSAAPALSVTDSSSPGQIDLYGVTASVGVETAHTTFDIGVNASFGSGKEVSWTSLQGVIDPSIVNVSQRNLYLFITSSYMF